MEYTGGTVHQFDQGGNQGRICACDRGKSIGTGGEGGAGKVGMYVY